MAPKSQLKKSDATKDTKRNPDTHAGGPGVFLLCGWFIQLFLLIVCLVLGWLTFVYFSSDIGRVGPVVDPDVYFPVEDRHFFNYSIASYEFVKGLNVLTAGDPEGKLLIFLHGFPETGILSWHHQIEYFASQGYFVVVPDQRGYNTSTKYESVDSYTLDILSEDIVYLITYYKRSKAVVVGHDWGAAVAWFLGTHHSSYLEKLVILNVPHPHVMQNTLKSSWTQFVNSWYIIFFQFPWVPEQKIYKDNFRWLTGALGMSPPGTFPRHVVKMYHEAWAQPGAITSMLNWYRSIGKGMIQRKKVDQRVPASLPTLMIWGDQDSALDVSMAKPSIDMCDNGKLEYVNGASHWVQHEQPERVNALIQNFITQ